MEDVRTDEGPVRRSLVANLPDKVAVYRGEELLRTVNCPTGGQRHQRTLKLLRDLDWTKLVMLNKKGDTLDVLQTSDHEQLADGDDDAAGVQLDPRDERDLRMVKLLIAAQKPVLEYRSTEVNDAMKAMTAVLQVVCNQVVGAIASIGELYQMQLQITRDLASGGAVDAGGDKPKASEKLLELLAPQLVRKLMAGETPAPAPAPKVNGTATPAADKPAS